MSGSAAGPAPAPDTVPVRSGEELDLVALTAWLARELPALASAAPLNVTQFPGGHSNLTYLLRWGEHDLVLRKPPVGSKVKGAHDMLREARVLEHLAGHYRQAPRALAACADPTVLGSPFYVMERVRGVILRGSAADMPALTPSTARRTSERLIDGLVELHAIEPASLGLGDLGHAAGYVERQVTGWAARWQAARTTEVPEVDAAFAWVVEHLAASALPVAAALVHNDYKYDNLVFDSGLETIVAVLDWEMATVGSPLLDLGTTLAYWIDGDDEPALQRLPTGPTAAPGGLRRAELVARYTERSGRDPGDVHFAFVFGLLKVAVIAQQIAARFQQGLTRDPRFAALPTVVAVLGRTARRAISLGRIDRLSG